ncbi:MAG: MBL fold metallo-hydrolase [Escherichia sp.]
MNGLLKWRPLHSIARKFHNTPPTPGYNGDKNAGRDGASDQKTENARPAVPLPLGKPILRACRWSRTPGVARSPWYLQLAGKRILIDPVLATMPRRSRSSIKAPAVSVAGRNYVAIDLLIISHDHYDHLDYATIRALLPKVKRVVTLLGVGSHLRYWGMKPEIIDERDWN